MAFFAPALILGSVSLGYGIYAWLSSGAKTQTKTTSKPVLVTAVNASGDTAVNASGDTAVNANFINKVVAAPSVVTATEITVSEPEVFYTPRAVLVSPTTEPIVAETSAELTAVNPLFDSAVVSQAVVSQAVKPNHRDIYIPISVQQEFYQRYRNVVSEISQRQAPAKNIRIAPAGPITAVRIRELREFRQLRDSRKKIARPILDGVQSFNKQSLKPATRRKLADKTAKPTLQDQIKSAVQQRFATSYDEI